LLISYFISKYLLLLQLTIIKNKLKVLQFNLILKSFIMEIMKKLQFHKYQLDINKLRIMIQYTIKY
jgi:hypothetical protein